MIGDDHILMPSVKVCPGFFPDPLGSYIPPLHALATSTRSRAREPSIISLFSPGALLFREPCILTTSRAIYDFLVCLLLGWIWTRRIQYACPLLEIFSSLPGFAYEEALTGRTAIDINLNCRHYGDWFFSSAAEGRYLDEAYHIRCTILPSLRVYSGSCTCSLPLRKWTG
jgi:hypothetical protein